MWYRRRAPGEKRGVDQSNPRMGYRMGYRMGHAKNGQFHREDDDKPRSHSFLRNHHFCTNPNWTTSRWPLLSKLRQDQERSGWPAPWANAVPPSPGDVGARWGLFGWNLTLKLTFASPLQSPVFFAVSCHFLEPQLFRLSSLGSSRVGVHIIKCLTKLFALYTRYSWTDVHEQNRTIESVWHLGTFGQSRLRQFQAFARRLGAYLLFRRGQGTFLKGWHQHATNINKHQRVPLETRMTDFRTAFRNATADLPALGQRLNQLELWHFERFEFQESQLVDDYSSS